MPYRSEKGFGSARTCDDIRAFWRYERTEYIDGAITVQGAPELPDDEPPLDPEEAKIRYFIGDVVDEEDTPPQFEARRGELVVLPVYMTTEIGLHELRMVFGFDPDQLEAVGFEVNFRDFDGVPFTVFLEPQDNQSSFFWNLECRFNPGLGHGECDVGEFPFFAIYHTDPPDMLPEGVWFADVQTVYRWVYREPGSNIAWLPSAVHWIGNAHLRVRDDATAPSTDIAGTEIEWLPVGALQSKQSQSSGFGFFDDQGDERIPIPALQVHEARVVITNPLNTNDVTFVRGDIVEDGSLNLTDPVGLLNSLFGGMGVVTCADAADVNDDGTLNVSDAVYLLQHLFSDGAEPPLPFPEPGPDPTEDSLGCERDG